MRRQQVHNYILTASLMISYHWNILFFSASNHAYHSMISMIRFFLTLFVYQISKVVSLVASPHVHFRYQKSHHASWSSNLPGDCEKFIGSRPHNWGHSCKHHEENTISVCDRYRLIYIAISIECIWGSWPRESAPGLPVCQGWLSPSPVATETLVNSWNEKRISILTSFSNMHLLSAPSGARQRLKRCILKQLKQ